MSGLGDAISWLQTQTRALPGVRYAPEYLPDVLADFPAVVAYEGPGDFKPGAASEYTALYTINVEVHVSRRDMARDLKTIRPFIKSIPNIPFLDPTLGGNVETYSNVTFSGLVGLLPASEGQIPTIGYRFVIQGVKIRP